MKIPSPGESISEVEIAQWLVMEGDYVFQDQSIVEVDSDKATLEIPAEASGQIKILAQAIEDFENVEFLFYEQTKNKDIAKALNIKYWATIVVFKGQEEIAKKLGIAKKEEIYKLIKKGI